MPFASVQETPFPAAKHEKEKEKAKKRLENILLKNVMLIYVRIVSNLFVFAKVLNKRGTAKYFSILLFIW